MVCLLLKVNIFKQSCCISGLFSVSEPLCPPSVVNGVIRTAKEVHILKAFRLIDRGEQYHVSLEREEKRAATGIVVITSQSISSEGNFKHFSKLLTAVCSLWQFIVGRPYNRPIHYTGADTRRDL